MVFLVIKHFKCVPLYREGSFGAQDPADLDGSNFSHHSEDAPFLLKINSEASADDIILEEAEEKLAESPSDLDNDPLIFEHEEENNVQSTEFFDCIVEGLQRDSPTIDEHGRELCTELYSLLGKKGQKLTREVMTAVITRETGKSVKMLLNNLSDQDKSKLKRVMPDESHRIFDSKTEHATSSHVLYGLHQIFLDENHHPKSGWGNPVRNTDIDIGDDVERLHMIVTIFLGISDPVNVSVENYIRLLDIMFEALTRLNPGAEFEEDLKTFANEITCLKQ